MKKVLFSAIAIMSVVGSALAVTSAKTPVTIYCSTSDPANEKGSPILACDQTVFNNITLTNTGVPFATNSSAYCSVTKQDTPCTLASLYFIQ